MQYQSSISVQYVRGNLQLDMYPKSNQYQNVQSQFLMGLPIVQYPQNQQQSQDQVNPHSSVIYQGFQQNVAEPQIQMVQPMNPRVAKELLLRQYTRYFYGCNYCFGVIALIFLIVRCINCFSLGGGSIAAAVLYIISDFFFVVGVICGIYGVSRYVEKMLIFYQFNLGIAMLFEIIGSIVSFITFKADGTPSNRKNNYNHYEYHSSYYDSQSGYYAENNYESQSNDDGSDSHQSQIMLIIFIIFLAILILAYGIFIRYARKIQYIMKDLSEARQNEGCCQQYY